MLLDKINALVWGGPTLLLVIGAGVYLSVRTGFLQLRLFPKAFMSFLQKIQTTDRTNKGVSSFQALCTALAATVGTGNIAGVAGAIAIGGPGAIFWMWISALLGMIIKFAEATLCVRFRVLGSDGSCYGGPMYMIQGGLPRKMHFLAGIYAFFGVIAAFGVGNATQINACLSGLGMAADACGFIFGDKVALLTAAVLSALVAIILLGGADGVGKLSQMIVPFASLGYILLCTGVLIARSDRLAGAIISIISGAFSPEAVTGGAVGSLFLSLRTGVSRGVFTNEAGMGTAGIAHAGAAVSHPVEQGMMGIMEVFLDTIVICTMTALAILCSGITVPYGTDPGAILTNRAFEAVYGGWVSVPIALFLCCFAFATMIGWGLYGIRCAQFLFGRGALKPFVIVQWIVSLLSAMLGTGTVWLLADIVNALMALPNLVAVVMLTPVLHSLIRDYKDKTRRGSALGGTYENINQRQSLRAVADAQIPPSCRCRGGEGEKDTPSEYWSA